MPLAHDFNRITIQRSSPGPAPAPASPKPTTPAECSPDDPRETAFDCIPNPQGSNLPPVGGTHTESHPFQPCLLTEAQVAASPDWCVDNKQAHGGEVCYRQIPKSAGDPGDQYCYSENCCHNSADIVTTVDPASPGSGVCCVDKLWSKAQHVYYDWLPEFMDDPKRVIEDTFF